MDEIVVLPKNTSELVGIETSAPLPASSGVEQTQEVHPAVTFNTDHPPALPYLVVGLGASAGGLEAYVEIFRTLPTDTGMAFVVVSHLSPDQKSHLVEILARTTSMPVSVIEDGVTPEPNRVYVLAPKTLATISGGQLRIEPRPERRITLAIDHFFQALAADQKNHAIGVLLSGMDSDGTLGLRQIKDEGGIAIVQTPATARYPEMPRSSLLADHIDLVLAPLEIAGELARLARQFSCPSIRAVELDALPEDDKHQFARIVHLLTGVSGIDYGHYKPATIQRRIGRRMLVTHMERLDQYVRYLQLHPEELRYLQEETLIGVTSFFRDPDLFSTLKGELFTDLLENRAPEEQIRIWVAGCSTGEEVYSTAICLLERLSSQEVEPPIKIFGTDASARAIQSARLGVYPASITNIVSVDRLRRFFVKVDKGYQISKRIRDLCVFARQNLCTDAPFSRLDLVSCRNVLIYMDRQLQNRVVSRLHYALRPAGFLILGNSETIRDFGDSFGSYNGKANIYVKRGSQIPLSLDAKAQSVTSPARKERTAAAEGLGVWNEMDLQRAADRTILARRASPGVIINEHLQILQSRGQTAPYLAMAPGVSSLHLMKMLRKDLAGQVHTAVCRAIEFDIPVQVMGNFRHDAVSSDVEIEVLPLHSPSPNPRYYLVLFSAVAAKAPLVTNGEQRSLELPPEELNRNLVQAHSDLTANRLYSQSLIEERDGANQQLISANEEILSVNEELQSTNEELETTKEELQSANEELQTVNEELQQRNNILSETTNDLTNLLTSVNIPVLMLNNDLQIRQFTPLAARLLNIRSSDIGRLLSELRLHLSVDDLEPVLRDVLETLGTREMEIRDREGRWRLLRIRPYRTADNRIEGVVLILVDIDEFRQSQHNLRQARDFSQAVIEDSHLPLAVLSMDFKIRAVNSAFRELSGLSAPELEMRSLPDVVNLLWKMHTLQPLLESLRSGEIGIDSFETQFETEPHDKNRVFCIWGRSLQADSEPVLLITMEDITRSVNAERSLEQLNRQLVGQVHSTEESLRSTEAELRALTASLFTSQEDERRRVARELHDDITQRLAVLEIDMDHFKEDPPKDMDGVLERVEGLRQRTAQLSEEVRSISHRLHPSILDDLGLPVALDTLVEEFGERENMPARFIKRNLPEIIPTIVAGVLYRIAQEALRNVSKYAGRTQVKVLLELSEGTLRLQISDAGDGFDMQEARRGLGLVSMAERARTVQGVFSIQSALGVGTTINVDVPFSESVHE
jgi:two-component system, chemotaxis family, CheB/CheR fusion protein